MFQCRVSSTVAVRSLLLFAICVLLPTWAQASDVSFDGGSGCDDPPIFSQVFMFTANTNGGLCRAFGNHSGMNFDSLRFVTTIPTVSSTFLCSPGPFFTDCAFSVDTVNHTLTLNFFGLDGPTGT